MHCERGRSAPRCRSDNQGHKISRVKELVKAGLGISTAIGIGGDPIIGTTTKEAVELLMNDPETDGIIMIGEIGGNMEAEAANWLKNNMSSYATWATTHNSLLIVTWDEDEGSGRIPTTISGQMVKPGSYDEETNHFGLLRTMTERSHRQSEARRARTSRRHRRSVSARARLRASGSIHAPPHRQGERPRRTRRGWCSSRPVRRRTRPSSGRRNREAGRGRSRERRSPRATRASVPGGAALRSASAR